MQLFARVIVKIYASLCRKGRNARMHRKERIVTTARRYRAALASVRESNYTLAI